MTAAEQSGRVRGRGRVDEELRGARNVWVEGDADRLPSLHATLERGHPLVLPAHRGREESEHENAETGSGELSAQRDNGA